VRILVDGRIYRLQQHGGINTLFNELLPRIAKQKDCEVELLLTGHPRGGVPEAVHRKLAPFPFAAGFLAKDPFVFLSTYFTETKAPRAVPVAVVYDLNHELFPEYYQGPWGRWLRRRYPAYLRHATRVIALSEKTKKDVLACYGLEPSRVDVVRPAVSHSHFFPDKPHPTEEAPYFLYVGGRQYYKNFNFLLRAFALQREARLIVAGKPWTLSEREHLHQLAIQDRVELRPLPDHEGLRRLYSGAAAFVFPSLHEGFGFPTLEAMACGCPVLLSDTEVFREVAGKAGHYFDPGSVDSLVAKLQAALAPDFRLRHSGKARARALEYSWDESAKLWGQSLRRALAS